METTPNDSSSSVRIAEVMNNTIAVFPSAFKFANTNPTSHTAAPAPTVEVSPGTTSHTSTHTPFITLHPTYITSISGDELLLSMHEVMASVQSTNNSKQPFISSTAGDTSMSFMERVRKFATRLSAATEAPSASLTSIPIYMLVLLRFELSLAESYASRDGAIDREKDSSMNDSSQIDATFDDFKGLMSRITGSNGTADTAEVQTALANLESELPGCVSEKSLAKLLLPPFTHVTKRLCSSDKHHVSLLQSIDAVYDGVFDNLGSSSQDIDSNGKDTVSQLEETSNAPNTGMGTKKSKKRKNKKKVRTQDVDDGFFSFAMFD